MTNETENLDSLNEEFENDNSENVGQSAQDNSKEEKPEPSDREKQLFARAKNNEDAAKTLREMGFERKDGKWVKPTPQEPSKSQSNEPDYSEKIDRLTLKSDGINHPDDQKIVLDEAKRLKLPVEEVKDMEYIKAKLEISKNQREAIAGAPKGRGQAGGQTQNDVDYWLAKGETPDDLELGAKVIKARIAKETNKNKFADELYSG